MAARGWPGAAAWARRAVGIAPTIVGGSKKHGGPDLGPTRARAAWAAMGVNGLGIADEIPGPDFPADKPPKLTVAMVARLQGFPGRLDDHRPQDRRLPSGGQRVPAAGGQGAGHRDRRRPERRAARLTLRWPASAPLTQNPHQPAPRRLPQTRAGLGRDECEIDAPRRASLSLSCPCLEGVERPGPGWQAAGQDIRSISRILLVASSAATL